MRECEFGVFGPFISWIVAWWMGYTEQWGMRSRLYSRRKGPSPHAPLPRH